MDGQQFRMLPTTCIIDEFVCNRKDSYEDYLIEFVNASSYFRKKSKGEPYIRPQSESNGECDCISPFYSLDFKMLVSKSMAQGMNCFTNGTTELAPGIRSIGNPKILPSDKKYKPIKGYLLQYLFRYISSGELNRLQKGERPILNRDGIELSKEECSVLRDALCPLQKEKNLLFMLPYEVICSEPGEDDLSHKDPSVAAASSAGEGDPLTQSPGHGEWLSQRSLGPGSWKGERQTW